MMMSGFTPAANYELCRKSAWDAPKCLESHRLSCRRPNELYEEAAKVVDRDTVRKA